MHRFAPIIALLALASYTTAEDCYVGMNSKDGTEVALCIGSGGQLSVQSRSDFNDTEWARLFGTPAFQPALEVAKEDASADLQGAKDDMNNMWVLLAGIIVFFMQAGFSLVEAGSVGTKNVSNILFKNIMDACLGCIFFWLLGFGLAYGGADDNAFIGTDNFALSLAADDDNMWGSFFFQFVFAATAATIVSGAVAERCKLDAYFIYSIVLTIWIYPPVVHWVWDDNGWLSAFKTGGNDLFAASTVVIEGETAIGGATGMIDFAGSGVVHMVGGWCALVAAYTIGPRRGRFDEQGKPLELRGHSLVLQTLGVFILWVGWYGFNPGSTLAVSDGMSQLASKVAVTTSISAATSAVTCTLIGGFIGGKYDLTMSLNSLLAGLVGITAACSVVEPWGACIIGIVSAFIYMGGRWLLLKLQIDDPLEASVIHGFCGFWGVLAAGIFATPANVIIAYGADNDAISSGRQFLTQFVGALAITVWSLGNAAVLFFGLKYTIGLRVGMLEEVLGLDRMEHGGVAYATGGGKDDVEGILDQAGKVLAERSMQSAHFTVKEAAILKDVFDVFDYTGSGYINAKELFTALRSLQLGLSDSELERMANMADGDKNGQISLEEFKMIFSGAQEKSVRKNSGIYNRESRAESGADQHLTAHHLTVHA